jgi:alpha-L-fucosidase
MYEEGTKEFDHHLATYGPQDKFGYKDFIPLFKADKFSASTWADLFIEAGAKFVVPVAEHHDGFAMYPTKQNKWNAKEMGPKRDVIGELAKATRERGMIFGLSSHRAEHWWFMNGGRKFPSDVQDPELDDLYGPAHPGDIAFGKNPPDEKFLNDWLARCTELVDMYQPQLFWFDWWIEQPEFAPYLRRFGSYYYNRAYKWGKGVAINYKHHAYPEKAAVFDVERGQLAAIRPRFWQTDTAVAKNSWSHVSNPEYKTAQSLIHDLVDIVSKNGALLLNIGPRADGSIPDEDAEILRTIGRWLKVNGEAIYGTRPWKVFGEGPTPVVEGSFKDTERAPFTQKDMRFTQKDGDLYITVLASKGGKIRVLSLGSNLALEPRTIEAITLLGGDTLTWRRNAEALEIDVPTKVPDTNAFTMRVRFE